jgi:hypothetical protein
MMLSIAEAKRDAVTWIRENLPHQVKPKGVFTHAHRYEAGTIPVSRQPFAKGGVGYLGHAWQDWCEEHVGSRVRTGSSIGAMNHDGMWEALPDGYCFSRPEDAFAFKMRWG